MNDKPNWLSGKIDAAETVLASHKPDKNDVLAFIGMAIVVRGVAMWSAPAAFIVAGLAFLFAAYYSTSSPTGEQS